MSLPFWVVPSILVHEERPGGNEMDLRRIFSSARGAVSRSNERIGCAF